MTIKHYLMLALIVFASVQTYRLNNAQHERDTLQTAITNAQLYHKQQTEALRLKEQEAVKHAQQSQTHTDAIMNSQPPKECEKLFQWMINPKFFSDV